MGGFNFWQLPLSVAPDSVSACMRSKPGRCQDMPWRLSNDAGEHTLIVVLCLASIIARTHEHALIPAESSLGWLRIVSQCLTGSSPLQAARAWTQQPML